MPSYIAELRTTIFQTTPLLEAIDEEASRRRPAPGKWCAREIIGHLIESASNIPQRFVRAQYQEPLVFPGYDQDAWVEFQRYRDAPWRELITLWSSFNLQIARVMECIPDEVSNRPRKDHNLDELAWKPVPRDAPSTLDYFMNDYVDHLKHHLNQIRALPRG